MIAPNELAAFKALPNLAIGPATSLPRQISSLAELDALVLSFWYKLPCLQCPSLSFVLGGLCPIVSSAA